MRTTLNIDTPVLQEVKRLQAEEGKSLGKVVSELLLYALNLRRMTTVPQTPKLNWIPKQMGSRVDLADRDAVYDAMDDGIRR